MRSVGRGVIQSGSDLGGGHLNAKPQSHNAALPVDAGYAYAVVAHPGDDPGDLCPVACDRTITVIRYNVIAVVLEVPAGNVVDEAIIVVVYFIVWNLVFVDPDIVLQVRVIHVDTGVQNGDHNVATARGDVPCVGHLDQLMGVLIGKLRVVRICTPLVNIVGLSILDIRIVTEFSTDARHISVGSEQIESQQLRVRRSPSGGLRLWRRRDCHCTRFWTLARALVLQTLMSTFEDRTFVRKSIRRLQAKQGGFVSRGARQREKAAGVGLPVPELDDDLARDV